MTEIRAATMSQKISLFRKNRSSQKVELPLFVPDQPGRHFIPQDDMPSFVTQLPVPILSANKKISLLSASWPPHRSTTRLAHFMQFVLIMFSPWEKCIPCRAWEPRGIEVLAWSGFTLLKRVRWILPNSRKCDAMNEFLKTKRQGKWGNPAVLQQAILDHLLYSLGQPKSMNNI